MRCGKCDGAVVVITAGSYAGGRKVRRTVCFCLGCKETSLFRKDQHVDESYSGDL